MQQPTANFVEHQFTTNNGAKKILIVNTYNRPKSLAPNDSRLATSDFIPSSPHHNHHQTSSSTRHLQASSSSSTANGKQVVVDLTSGGEAPTNNNNNNNKYAIKHKANRYVSGAIGILETSLNGEYVILENLSGSKSVNLKGWYLHRYVPDQNINVIYKFTDDCVLNSGEKLRIYAESYRHGGGANTTRSNGDLTEKLLHAENVASWGKYSRFSVTKLINQDGVDKAVLTQSLLKLASSASTNNLNQISGADSCETKAHTKRINPNVISKSPSSTTLLPVASVGGDPALACGANGGGKKIVESSTFVTKTYNETKSTSTQHLPQHPFFNQQQQQQYQQPPMPRTSNTTTTQVQQQQQQQQANNFNTVRQF